jgi:peptidoglycan hydrolase CwlO-like protein
MTRTTEPDIGTTGLPNYKSPTSRILRSLRKGYDNLRAKQAEKSETIQSLREKLRDTQDSRDFWKEKAKVSESEAATLKQENEKLKEDIKKRGDNHR